MTGVQTGAGIQFRAGTAPFDGGSAIMHVAARDNHVEMPTDNGSSPYYGTSESGTLCLDLQGNQLDGADPFAFTAFAQPSGSTFQLDGFTGVPAGTCSTLP